MIKSCIVLSSEYCTVKMEDDIISKSKRPLDWTTTITTNYLTVQLSCVNLSRELFENAHVRYARVRRTHNKGTLIQVPQMNPLIRKKWVVLPIEYPEMP